MKKLAFFYGMRSLNNRATSNICYNFLDKKKSLLLTLETRLDVILLRLYFCSTLFRARQLITHKKICVNFNVVNIPGFTVKTGDLISILPSYLPATSANVKLNLQNNRACPGKRPLLSHLEVNYKTFNAILLYEPTQIHFPYKIDLDILF
jgi:ribosomal protein S4